MPIDRGSDPLSKWAVRPLSKQPLPQIPFVVRVGVAAHRLAEKVDKTGILLERGRYTPEKMFNNCRFYIGACPWSRENVNGYPDEGLTTNLSLPEQFAAAAAAAASAAAASKVMPR